MSHCCVCAFTFLVPRHFIAVHGQCGHDLYSISVHMLKLCSNSEFQFRKLGHWGVPRALRPAHGCKPAPCGAMAGMLETLLLAGVPRVMVLAVLLLQWSGPMVQDTNRADVCDLTPHIAN